MTIRCRAMAIRFQCGSCAQPIEVDDEWASRAVACPYCRKTVTAPAESTLGDIAEVPVATPLMGRPASDVDAAHTRQASAENPNWLAIVALGLAVGLLVQLGIAAMILNSNRSELRYLEDRIAALQREGKHPWSAAQQASAEYYEDHDGAPPLWMGLVGLLYLGAGVAWLGAIVCGLVAMRRQRRRVLAVAALVVAGATVVLLCGGGLLNLAPQA